MEPPGRLLLCWLLLLAPAPAPAAAAAALRHPLPVLWMMPAGHSGEENLTAGVAPAVQLALQDLREQPAPLGGYELQLQLLDSQCDAPSRLKALFEAMWAGPKFLLLFGGVCPVATAMVARALPALHLVQVSFAASSPSLSYRKWYGNLFSTVPSDRAVNQATVKLLQRFRWNRVGVVTQEGERLSEMNKDLTRQLLKAEVQVVAMEILDEACSSLRKLKERDVRIFIGQFEDAAAGRLFCCAYRLNLFGSRYQWILAGGGVASWGAELQDAACSSDHLQAAADASIRLQITALGSSDTAGVSGRTPQEYQDAYLRKLTQERAKVSPLHAFAYDAVWVAAKALSEVMESLRRRQKFSAGRNASVSEEEAERLLLEAVRRTQLQGVTGPISFRNGERMSFIQLLQIQDSSGVLVGEFSTSTQQLRLTNHLLKFKGPGPARDRTQVRVQQRRVGLLPLAIMSSAAAAIFIIALSCLLYILIYHELWYERRGAGGWGRSLLAAAARRSARSQDELLLLGLLLTSSSILLAGLDEAWLPEPTLELLCSVRLWILSVGQTLSFSVLLARAWSVYSLCSGEKPAGGVVLGLVLLDLLLLTSWQVVDPLRRVEVQHSSETDVEQDVLLLSSSASCSSSHTELWLTVVWAHRGPLLGLGCLLAWNIRGARAAGGERLARCLFAVTLFAVMGASASLMLSHNPPLLFCLSGSLILCCNVSVLSWLFGAKFLRLWQNGGVLPKRDEQDEQDEQLRELNQQLRSRAAQLQQEEEAISLLLTSTLDAGVGNHGEDAHVAQTCNTDAHKQADINSPELVRRRLSMQLPILHHSYLPVVGGISASSSGLFSSLDALVNQDVLTTL